MRPFESKSHLASARVGALLGTLAAGEFPELDRTGGVTLALGRCVLFCRLHPRLGAFAIPTARVLPLDTLPGGGADFAPIC
jgi:hypothetical protein